MNIATAVISAALVAGPHDVPPVLPIPDALEICILKAELCAAQANQPWCGWQDYYALKQCTTSYEDCAWWIDEMHDDGCRQSHATCALEAPLYPMVQWYQDFCEAVNKTCPSI
jgi:hypothetical protein